MTRTVHNRRRSRTGCSILALATVLAVGPSPAAAQSLLGTGTYATNPNATGITTGVGTTTINLNAGNTVIDWTPTDPTGSGNVVFQNAGTVATFSGSGDFAVLNNINGFPTRAIQMDGTINARVGSAQRGSVYFYAPGGFVFGGSSVFNVGSLGVSTLPISNADFMALPSNGLGSLAFGQASNPDSTIVMNGTVDASVQPFGAGGDIFDSYVAMIAPRVVHNGTMTVNGSVALVAAEAATINFSPDGLFDIQVTVGSDEALNEGINVHGDITGPTPTGATDKQGIYLVAVPKNDAMTMVIGGGADLGFTLANTAVDDNGTIVLSAGHDIVDGAIGARSAGHGEAATANFWFTGARARNNLFGEATGTADLYSTSGTPSQLLTVFDNDVTVHAGDHVWMNASGSGASLTVGGNLHLSTDESAEASGGSAQGGETALYALNGGTLTVNGTALLTANAYGGSTESSGQSGGTGTGGLVIVRANDTGSSLTVTGALTAEANGQGGTSFSGNGGAGFGGATANGGGVTIDASGGTLTLNDGVTASASGIGGDAYAAGWAAGDGTGGRAGIYAINGGVVGVSGNATVTAGGDGGTHWIGGTGGVGTGGTAELDTSGSTASQINISGSAYLSSIGTGGDSFNLSEGPLGDGGDAFGGKTRAAANQGLIRITGNLFMDSTASGGSGATGGDATGVTTPSNNEGLPPAAMIWAGSANAEVRVTGLTDIDVSATGGTGYNGGGGAAIGGEIDIVSQLGHVNLGNVTANADADGGDGGNGGAGGNASGGAIDVTWSLNGGPLTGTISADTVALSAIGQGGDGGVGASGATGGTGGAGGSGTGGGVSYVGSAAGATFDVGATTIVADGRGGTGGSGGIGTAGVGGTGGAGGSGTGGFIQTGTISNSGNLGSGGTATFTNLSASSGATGGNGGNGGSGSGGTGIGGAGGNATAGEANFLVRGIVVTANTINLFANATAGNGGSGSTAGIGGNAVSGLVSAESKDRFEHPSQRGSLTADAINGTAIATAGTGAVNGTSTVQGGSYFRVLNGDANIGSVNFQFSGAAYNNSLGPNYIQAEGGTATVGTLSYNTTGDLAIYTTNTGALDVGSLNLTAGNFVDHPSLAGPATPGTIFATSLSVTSGGDFVADANFNVTNGIGINVPGAIRFDNATSAAFIDLWAQGGSLTVDNVNAGGNATLRGGTSVAVANVDTGGDLLARAFGGDLSLANLESAGSMQLYASEDVLVSGDIDAGTSLTSLAGGVFNGNDILAGSFIDIGTGSGITLDDLTAGDDIHLGSSGPITIDSALSGETIDFETEATLTAGNLTAGDSVLGQALGAISVGTVSAGIVDPSTAEGAQHRVSFASGESITTGAITAAGNIGFGTPGNLLTGNLDSGGGIMALVGGNISLPTVHADSYVFLADYSMSELGGDFDTFNRDAVLAAEPVLTGGSISITGPLTAGSFVTAAAGTNLTYASISAGGNVDLRAGNDISGGGMTSAAGNLSVDAGGAISVGALSSGLDIDLDAIGNILFTSANAGSDFDFSSGGSVTGGNVVATNEISGRAAGSVTLSNLTAGLPEEDDVSVGISAVGNISVGDVTGTGPVGFATQGNLSTGAVNAGEFFLAMVGGDTATGAITTTGVGGGQVYIADDSMFLTGGGTWDDEGDFDPSVVFALDPVRTGGSITIAGPVNTGLFRVAAGTSLTTGTISSGGGIGLDASGSITTGNLVADNFVLANGGSITTGSIDADSVDMESTGGNITIGGDVTANGLVELDAFGDIVTDNITAGTIELAAGGSITTDNLTTELPLVFAAADFQGMPVVDTEGEGNIILIAGGDILTGDITAAESILLVTPGNITGETIEAGNIFMALAHGDMSFGDATAAEVFLADFAMYSQGGGGEVSAICVGTCGTLGADGVVTASPSGSTYTYVTTAGGLSGAGQLPGEGGTNGSDYTTSTFSAAAGDDLEFWFNYVTSDGAGYADYAWASLLTADLEPVAILFTARTQSSGTIVPGFDLPGVEATLDPATVPIIDGGPAWSPLGGSSGGCYSAGCGYTGWVNSEYEIAEAGNYVLRFGVTNWGDSGYDSGMAFSGITIGGVPVESTLTPTGGSITIGNVSAGKMTAAAGTTLTTGIIDVTDFANLVSGGNMVTNAITAGNNLWADAGGTMTLGVLSGGDIELDSVGNMSFVSGNAGTEFDFDSEASVNGGNVTAGNQISGDAGGSITLANLAVSGLPLEGENFSIGITALGNISVGNVTGAGPVGFGTPEDLTTGNVTAGDLFMTLVGGDIAINGPITTTGEGSQVYMADYSMCATGGGCEEEGDFDPGIVLALDPVATGGSISITGAVTTGTFDAAAGTSLTTQAITTSGDIHARAGGTATLNGLWNSGDDVNLASNDIEITVTGGINAADSAELFSTNATQALIGDGLTGTGYALSNAEFGRISGYNVGIGGRGDASAAIDMLIGDLTITGPLAGSTVEGAEGILGFGVGDIDGQTASGVIRVTGDVAATGFGSGNAIEFYATRFELDAATGSVSIFSSGNTLAGELGLYADRIHVAEGAILNQLAANPTYTGYQQDLNETPTTQRPEGVLRADTLWIESDNLQDILIQNTGTGGQGGVPAGFVVRQAFINEEIDTPPGSVNLIINGQVVTEGGTLTGVAARDELVGDSDTTGATANSTINGCPLTGACIIQTEEPPPNPDVVEDQIDLITDTPLGDGEFGNEDSIDDNEEGDEGADNPISPPQPLFDTRPLIPSGDVSDPVSGTGNPALTGGAAECEEGEDGECPAEQSDGEGE